MCCKEARLRSRWGAWQSRLGVPGSHLLQHRSRRLVQLPVPCAPLLCTDCWSRALAKHTGPSVLSGAGRQTWCIALPLLLDTKRQAQISVFSDWQSAHCRKCAASSKSLVYLSVGSCFCRHPQQLLLQRHCMDDVLVAGHDGMQMRAHRGWNKALPSMMQAIIALLQNLPSGCELGAYFGGPSSLRCRIRDVPEFPLLATASEHTKVVHAAAQAIWIKQTYCLQA